MRLRSDGFHARLSWIKDAVASPPIRDVEDMYGPLQAPGHESVVADEVRMTVPTRGNHHSDGGSLADPTP